MYSVLIIDDDKELCALMKKCVNGEIYDLGRPINEDAEFVLYKWEDEQGKHAFWHTSAHLLAEALQELYPGIQFGIGPAIENGLSNT